MFLKLFGLLIASTAPVQAAFSASVNVVPFVSSATTAAAPDKSLDALAQDMTKWTAVPRAQEEIQKAAKNLLDALQFSDRATLIVTEASSGYDATSLSARESAVRVNAWIETRDGESVVEWSAEKMQVDGGWTKTHRRVQGPKRCMKHKFGFCVRYDHDWFDVYDPPSADSQAQGLHDMHEKLMQEMHARGWTGATQVLVGSA